MNTLLAIPFELRMIALFVLGACIGGQINRAVYAWAVEPRPISPWSAPPKGVAPRRWRDCLPIFGWLIDRGESKVFGKGFWFRPMLVELLTGLALAALYAWEVDVGGLLTLPLPGANGLRSLPVQTMLHCEYLAHATLLCLMIAASLIDIDDKIIPDEITLPGTLIGLLLIGCLPQALLPVKDDDAWNRLLAGPFKIEPITPLLATFPLTRLQRGELQPKFTDTPASLYVGLAIVIGWCFALLPRHWRSRHGLRRARQIFCARIAKEPLSKLIAAVGGVSCILVALVYGHGGPHWESLFSSLVGLAASGGLIWAVRLIAGWVMRREAMGFGDVTLMCMIGAFLGWQACLLVFFIGPFLGLLIGGSQYLLNRENEIPYGPYLCLGAATVIVFWNSLWDRVAEPFKQDALVPTAVVLCMVALGVVLGLMQLLKRVFGAT